MLDLVLSAVFPEQLANDHIISWSNEGDLVYDPFMGSGTTAKMAISTGLNRYHHTIVSGIAGNTLTLTAALPANVAVGRKILINRWVAR